jgi:hypothetical protein
LPLPRFSRLPGTAAAHTRSRPSIAAAAARTSNMPGIGMAVVAAITVVEDITAVEDTMMAAIKATTIKAADRG